MAEMLKIETLGEKHLHRNKLVKEMTATDEILHPKDFKEDEGDIKNIIKIDIANNKRNVDYILEVLKSEDMLLVSRAIKGCNWLITDPLYAHIINPNYLYSQLFPQMTTKGSIKLIKYIRLHLKDEGRAEDFYKNEKDFNKAAKWLPNCSVSFIESEVKKHSEAIGVRLLKRLSEKSITILEAYIEKRDIYANNYFQATTFLVNIDPNRYLDLVEKRNFPKFGAKTTDLIMKKCSNRIINNFEKYNQCIHLPTFAKHMKKENVKEFLYKQVNRERRHVPYSIYNFKFLRLLINLIPESERFQFVNDVFINKIHTDKDTDINTEKYKMRRLCMIIIPRTPIYKFYEFAPFDVAFEEIKKLIRAESSFSDRNSMLNVLITCANRDKKNIQNVLEYYRDKHHNDSHSWKTTFIDKLIAKTDFHRFNETTWNILNAIYEEIRVYIETKEIKQSQSIIDSIIIYKLIHDDPIPDIIQKQFKLHSLKPYLNKLDDSEKVKVFDYLQKAMLSKIQNHNISNEIEFQEAIHSLEKAFNLLVDWDKELLDYPWVFNKFQEFFKMKQDFSYSASLSSMYNKKKSWRKHMFAQSLDLCPSEDVCINILKHDPHMLSVNNKSVKALCCDDRVSLKRLLSKLRIYWAETLANQWTTSYLERLNQLQGHKALIRGLCALLPLSDLLEIIRKYAPQEAEINWNNINELELSLQRHIAKNMHFARPQPPGDVILLYAKGDYLQYALPSLLAIFYNLNIVRTREHIPRLLDAPVSVRKHGIRLAFNKLPPNELQTVFLDIWKNTKNASIRAIIFKFTYDLLCREETNSTRIKSIWATLESFIDNLTYEEDKNIYVLLTVDKVRKVPIVVRAEYLIKSYNFLKRLLPNLTGQDNDKYKAYIKNLVEYTRDIMKFMPSDFMENILKEYIDASFFDPNVPHYILSVVSEYLLCTTDVNDQNEKYEKILVPLIQRCVEMWHKIEGNEYFIRKNLQSLLDTLCEDLKRAETIPVQMYSNILNELKKLIISENYIMITKWKLTVELAKTFGENNANSNWDAICLDIAPKFGDSCLQYLKDDITTYFPCVYLLFARALSGVLNNIPNDAKWKIYQQMTTDENCIPAYLVLINQVNSYYHTNQDLEMAKELRKILRAHSSVEVKMHCYHKFKQTP